MAPIVALHDQLMSPGDQCEAVGVVESLGDVLAKGVSSATRGNSPATTVIRVRPQQITHGTLMWDFLESVQGPDVVQCVYGGGEATMQAEDLAVY